MPIIEPAELLGHITTSDGRQIPHYKVKTETTITHVDTGACTRVKNAIRIVILV